MPKRVFCNICMKMKSPTHGHGKKKVSGKTNVVTEKAK
jgi:hypothetical protein